MFSIIEPIEYIRYVTPNEVFALYFVNKELNKKLNDASMIRVLGGNFKCSNPNTIYVFSDFVYRCDSEGHYFNSQKSQISYY